MITPQAQRPLPPLVRAFEERPLFPVALYFLLGITLGAWHPIPVNYGILAAVALSLLLAVLYTRRCRLLLGALALALMAGVTAVSAALPAWAADPWAPQDAVLLSGRIVEARTEPGKPAVYVLDQVTLEHQSVQGRVSVTTVQEQSASHGVYTAMARMYRPSGTAFYADFNTRGFQMRRGVRFQAWAQGREAIAETHLRGPAAWLEHFRDYSHQTLYAYLPQRCAALVDALLSGDRDGIDSDTSDAFNRLGVAHLLAVSGLNITLTAGAAWLLLRRLRVPLALTAAASVAVLLCYVAYAGLSPSVLRATAMWLTVLLARLTARRYDGLSALSAAALLVLVLNPLDLFDVGFQLSFAATAAILLWLGPLQRCVPRRHKLLRWLAGALGVTLCVQAMALPLLTCYFNNLPLWSPLVNLFLVPASFVIQLGGMALLAVGWLDAAARPVGALLGGFTGLYLNVVQWLAAHAAVLAVASPPLPLALVYGLGALALSPSVLRLKRRGRVTVAAGLAVLALVMLIPWPQPLAYRGDAIVLRESGGMSLYWRQDGREHVACAGNWYTASHYARMRGIGAIDELYFLSAEPPPDGEELGRMAVRTVIVPDSWPNDPAAVAFLEDAGMLGIAVRMLGETGQAAVQQDGVVLRVSAVGRNIAYVPWVHNAGETAVAEALAGADFAALNVTAKQAAALGAGIPSVALPGGVATAAARAYNMDTCASLALSNDGETSWSGEWADGLSGNFR